MKKTIIILLGFLTAGSAVSQKKQPAEDWYQQKTSRKNMGIDLYSAYDLLKDKKPSEIVVAVIDGGTDITHPDLINNIWHNPGEIPFNGIDDDHNGYVDDTVGWNFIGGANGAMVQYDNLEMTRLYRKLMKEYEDVDAEDIGGNEQQQAQYRLYQEIKMEVTSKEKQYSNLYNQFKNFKNYMEFVVKETGSENPSLDAVEKLNVALESDAKYKETLVKYMKKGAGFSVFRELINQQVEQLEGYALYQYNVDYDPRSIVGDNYSDGHQKDYGNNNVAGPDASHGTHVAGIISATRNNGIGMNGIANARIMVVRVVPDGDERDKDVANGIRYAVDNGAKIINMSFGKAYKWDKELVNEAVQYAVSKGVLLIHAAGNDNKNTDVMDNFPNDKLDDGKLAATWIEVGASAPPKKDVAADFSNYGQTNVDLFAPGYEIYSTIPDNKYAYFSGTSMAAPVTSGVAALVWSYYPGLSAGQVKEILMKSVVVDKKKVPIPGEKKKAKFATLSVTGGILNAYNALKLAESYSK